jgi:hypothetical protein
VSGWRARIVPAEQRGTIAMRHVGGASGTHVHDMPNTCTPWHRPPGQVCSAGRLALAGSRPDRGASVFAGPSLTLRVLTGCSAMLCEGSYRGLMAARCPTPALAAQVQVCSPALR